MQHFSQEKLKDLCVALLEYHLKECKQHAVELDDKFDKVMSVTTIQEIVPVLTFGLLENKSALLKCAQDEDRAWDELLEHRRYLSQVGEILGSKRHPGL